MLLMLFKGQYSIFREILNLSGLYAKIGVSSLVSSLSLPSRCLEKA
jgi:hypothetical protein